MAQNFRNYLKRNTGTTPVDLLGGAVGSSTYDCIVSLRLANTTTSTITVEVYITDTDNEFVQIKQAVVSGELVDSNYVVDLATVPPKEELVARIAGGLVGKVRELMLLLDATTRDFSGLIEARAVQLEAENDDS